jgi:BASS family bile acid:Na+ symporter
MWTIIYILVVPLTGGMLLRHHLSQPLKPVFVAGHLLLAILLISLMYSQSGCANWQIILCALFVLVLPLTGLLLGKGLSSITLRWAREIAPAIASLAIIVICAYAVAKNQQQIANVGLIVFVLVVLLNALGYLAGWYLAKLYRFDQAHQLTLSIEIGMQNAGMGVALALAHFSDQPEVALPGALFAVWCIITAAGASSWLRHKHALVTG